MRFNCDYCVNFESELSQKLENPPNTGLSYVYLSLALRPHPHSAMCPLCFVFRNGCGLFSVIAPTRKTGGSGCGL